MLKATYIKNATSPIYDRWQIYFYDPQSKEWDGDGDYVGNVYRSAELQQLGYVPSYEFYFCDPGTLDIIQMFFRNQWELMKFLTHIGNELRAQATRR